MLLSEDLLLLPSELSDGGFLPVQCAGDTEAKDEHVDGDNERDPDGRILKEWRDTFLVTVNDKEYIRLGYGLLTRNRSLNVDFASISRSGRQDFSAENCSPEPE